MLRKQHQQQQQRRCLLVTSGTASVLLLALLAVATTRCTTTNAFVPCAAPAAYSSLLSSQAPRRSSAGAGSKATETQLYGLLDQFQQLVPKGVGVAAPSPKVKVPDDFVLPEPKPLTLTRFENLGDTLNSAAALAVRLATGVFVLGWKIDTFTAPVEDGKYALQLLGPLRIRDSSSVLADAPRPTKPLILYEYAASPYCQRVRETINVLDLTVEYRPCPGARQGAFSQELLQRTGRQTLPFLIDPNNGNEMFESSDIIEYLLQTYGPQDASSYDRKALWPITWEAFSVATATQVAILRGMPGARRQANARPDNERMQPLELWGYECSPFVRPVREALGALCLPHVMVSCSRGSANRDRLVARTGNAFQVPFLVDPNTGIEMFESAEIVDYLNKVYTVDE